MDTSESSTDIQTDFIPCFYPSGKLPMTGRNRVITTIFNETPDRLPRSFTANPSVQKERSDDYKQELEQLLEMQADIDRKIEELRRKMGQ